MKMMTLWNKLTDKENPFRTGWAWILSGVTVAVIGTSPLLMSIGFENLLGTSGGNPVGLGLLAMLAFGLSQLCLLIALIWMGYAIFCMFCSPTS